MRIEEVVKEILEIARSVNADIKEMLLEYSIRIEIKCSNSECKSKINDLLSKYVLTGFADWIEDENGFIAFPPTLIVRCVNGYVIIRERPPEPIFIVEPKPVLRTQVE